MVINQKSLPGVSSLSLDCFEDRRGSFVKTYSHQLLAKNNAALELREEFYSFSKKGVLRGMHFQLPPHDHVKAVYCPLGSVLDVLLDLRKGLNYGKTATFTLTSSKPTALIIPKGVAHGFMALEDNSLMIYKTSTEYAPTHDAGIKWDSFGFEWGSDFSPIISQRDSDHPPFCDFNSPF